MIILCASTAAMPTPRRRRGGVIVVVVVCASLQIQLLSTKDKGRPWPQFIHDFEVNCSKEAQLLARSKQMMIPVYSGSTLIVERAEKGEYSNGKKSMSEENKVCLSNKVKIQDSLEAVSG